jgi:hypothetical protein
VNVTLVKALVALALASILFCVATIAFLSARRLSSYLQLAGAAALLSVVIAHICEGLELLPWMHWGEPDSAGHYVDLVSAVLGLTLLPLGFLLHIVAKVSPGGGGSGGMAMWPKFGGAFSVAIRSELSLIATRRKSLVAITTFT